MREKNILKKIGKPAQFIFWLTLEQTYSLIASDCGLLTRSLVLLDWTETQETLGKLALHIAAPASLCAFRRGKRQEK